MFNLSTWTFCPPCTSLCGSQDQDLCIYRGHFPYNTKIYIDWELLSKLKVYFHEIYNKCEHFGTNNLKIHIYYNCLRLSKNCKTITLLYKIYTNQNILDWEHHIDFHIGSLNSIRQPSFLFPWKPLFGLYFCKSKVKEWKKEE